VSREEIRQCLWPETHVDFDASLHFCIRQIREALGDSAADPRYIQTVPRRGYRLIPDVVRVDSIGERPREDARPRRRLIAALALAAIALPVGGLALRGGWLRASPVRVAIMPFPRPTGAEGPGGSSGVAEWILEDLARVAGDAAGIVGPTTTSAYGGSAADLQRLAADYNVQYILNGRLLEADGGSQLLAELIRVSDGVHVWVRRYDTAIEASRLAREISRNVARALELGSAGVDGP
jgi:TolB-like protein